MRGVAFRFRISPRIRSQNRYGSNGSVRDPCRAIAVVAISAAAGVPVVAYISAAAGVPVVAYFSVVSSIFSLLQPLPLLASLTNVTLLLLIFLMPLTF